MYGFDMRLSAIVPTYDRPEKLAYTLDCLQRQSLSPEQYEILVVDNGSSPAIRLPEAAGPARCRLIRFEQNVERVRARNTAAEAADGDVLFFSDDDMGMGPGFLEAHLRAQEEWPGALVIGRIILPPEALDQPCVRFRQALEHQGLPTTRGPVAMRNLCSAANMSIRRDRYLQLGGFDDAMVGVEDQDFAMRHTAAGGTIVFLPEAESVHHDDWLDIRSYCRRQEWASECTAGFSARHPDWADSAARERVNGPVRWGREPLSRSAQKSLKSALAFPPALAGLFGVVDFLERRAPTSPVLERLYRLLLGIHIQRGYRTGLKKLGIVAAGGAGPMRQAATRVEIGD